ncbi:C39 family peptidase [Paenibacillus sanfengchensis]|uniref:C39 family peptidase n=1 Tax=Paenibacillus sanfengchensis TaxID=3119819 RepID=UPI002FE358B1
MSIKVDPAKIDELSLKLKGLGDGIEDGERRVHQSLYRFLQDLRGRYYEEKEVQRALDAVEDSLREVTDSARVLTSSLHQKAKGLTQASQAYLDSEETVKKTMQQHFSLPSSYYGKSGALTGDGAAKYLKDPLFEDPVVQKLHQQALHGTEEEKQEAKQKLDTIFKARYDIGRAQVAYSVYKAFNNKPLMEGAHKEAERLRKVLKGLGIDEKYYGKEVKLSHPFSGAPIQACSYDPSFSITKDGEFIPMEMPKDNQYIYLLGLMMKSGKERAWAKSQLGEIHKLLTEIGRSQTAWHEYKAKNMQKEMDGAHAYAEKLRTALKTKYSLSSEMVDDVDYRELWVGAGPAGQALLHREVEDKGKKVLDARFDFSIYQKTVKANSNPGGAYKRNHDFLVSGDLKSKLPDSTKAFLLKWWQEHKAVYEKIGRELDIPPELIFAIHYRECQKYFSSGKAFEYSMQDGKNKIPKGTTFEEDSIRVLKNQLKKMNFGVQLTYDSKDLAAMLVFAELYNGFGYYLEGQNSTYIFNQTTIGTKGKYTSDSNFKETAKDVQPGIAAILLGVFGEGTTKQAIEAPSKPSQTNKPKSPEPPKNTNLGSYKSVASAGIQNWTTIPNLSSMPIYSQDRYVDGTRPSWYYEKLGNSSDTAIYKAGCTLTAVAMAESWKNGKVITPSQLNKELKRKNVFSGASLKMESIPNIQFDRHMGNEALFKSTTSSDKSVETLFKYAKSSIDQGNPVLIDITKPNLQKSAPSGHWILAVGYDEKTKDMLIVNPSGGEVTSLKKMLKNGSAKGKYKGWVVADYNELYSKR